MVTKQMAYSTPGDVAIAYLEGHLSCLRAVGILMTQFGWEQKEAEELLDEVGGPEQPPHDITDPDSGEENGPGDTNGDDPSDPGVSPGDYSLVGIVAFLWLLSKVF